MPIWPMNHVEAYQNGKNFYFSRRGQLDLSCFHCHFNNAGSSIRANVLGPTLGALVFR